MKLVLKISVIMGKNKIRNFILQDLCRNSLVLGDHLCLSEIFWSAAEKLSEDRIGSGHSQHARGTEKWHSHHSFHYIYTSLYSRVCWYLWFWSARRMWSIAWRSLPATRWRAGSMKRRTAWRWSQSVWMLVTDQTLYPTNRGRSSLQKSKIWEQRNTILIGLRALPNSVLQLLPCTCCLYWYINIFKQRDERSDIKSKWIKYLTNIRLFHYQLRMNTNITEKKVSDTWWLKCNNLWILHYKIYLSFLICLISCSVLKEEAESYEMKR